MILLCGIPTETPLAMVASALDSLGEPYVLFNQRRFATTSIVFELFEGDLTGWLEIDGSGYALDAFAGIYTRLMDFRRLPELDGEAETSPAWKHCAAVHDALTRWSEISNARVVNRMAPMGSNSSKPYQAQLIRKFGFEVPETLITNQPDQVLDFRSRHGRIIYKSISGIRSIVQTFEEADLDRLATIRWCPTQFQEYVEGEDIRVHVVDREIYATRVESSAVDYRYAKTQVGVPAVLSATQLPEDVEARCVRLASGLGLAFAGIDLRRTPDDRYYCFEVNPCPGYSYYEANTGQPIAMAVARHLAGRH